MKDSGKGTVYYVKHNLCMKDICKLVRFLVVASLTDEGKKLLFSYFLFDLFVLELYFLNCESKLSL